MNIAQGVWWTIAVVFCVLFIVFMDDIKSHEKIRGGVGVSTVTAHYATLYRVLMLRTGVMFLITDREVTSTNREVSSSFTKIGYRTRFHCQ